MNVQLALEFYCRMKQLWPCGATGPPNFTVDFSGSDGMQNCAY